MDPAFAPGYRIAQCHLPDFFDDFCQRTGVNYFFNTHTDEIIGPHSDKLSTLGVTSPQIKIFNYSRRHADLVNELDPGENGFTIVSAGCTVRTMNQPAVFNRKTGLKLISKGNAVLTATTMLSTLPVLPAILITFKYKPVGIFTQQFRWNFLVAVFEKKQKIIDQDGIISAHPMRI